MWSKSWCGDKEWEREVCVNGQSSWVWSIHHMKWKVDAFIFKYTRTMKKICVTVLKLTNGVAKEASTNSCGRKMWEKFHQKNFFPFLGFSFCAAEEQIKRDFYSIDKHFSTFFRLTRYKISRIKIFSLLLFAPSIHIWSLITIEAKQ